MKTTLRILAGIISIPFVMMFFAATFTFCIAVSLVVAIPGFILWLCILPFMFMFGCAKFAFDNNTSTLKYAFEIFIDFIDPMNGFRDVVMPIVVGCYNMLKECLAETKALWVQHKNIIKTNDKSNS